ncbi:MAG: SDR family oxidoreductase [Actinomycetia bacterium]|nr:SDR family oxidoreductase [Actinomycetes bacterium]MCP3910042.1 SDR family oxidoreductase [Actinomycetes bacterium]MCP4086623.1 SDR family oxidoreductase [Actinomycetes bacterium]
MAGVLVTGGSRGIGAATARLLASQGHDVAVSYRSRSVVADEVVAQCREFGVAALSVEADIGSEADVIRMFETVDEDLGGLSHLVNNAATISPQGRLENYSLERIQGVVGVNVVGAMLCAREAVRRLSTASGGAGGSIVNVSSVAASLGSPNEYIDYAATKGAIDSMTVGLAKEVGRDGIRVNAVRPGLIETEIHAAAGEPGRVARLADRVPMGRGGTAEEVAETIVWLLSDAASYVTGALLDVSGGR